MRVYTDFKRLLRRAKIPFVVNANKPAYKQLMVTLTPDVLWMNNQYTPRFMVTLAFTPDYYVTISSPQKSIYAQGLKRTLSVSVFCFTCEELVQKLEVKGYLTNTDGEKIKSAAKQGYKYKRAKVKVKKILPPTATGLVEPKVS